MIAGMQDFAPPTLLAQASRMNFSARFFNLLVTNVPGPQFPLYLLGKRLRAVFPLAFLAGDRALAIAVMSYDGGVNFGLIADLDSMPDSTPSRRHRALDRGVPRAQRAAGRSVGLAGATPHGCAAEAPRRPARPWDK